MIKKRFYLEIPVDPYNRYIVDGDPRDEFITLSRQKRNSPAHGWTVLSSMQLPAIHADSILSISTALVDAIHLAGILKNESTAWLDNFVANEYSGRRANKRRNVSVTLVEFE